MRNRRDLSVIVPMKAAALALSAVLGLASSASAVVLSGGPSLTPPGGGSCGVTTNANCNGTACTSPAGTGGVTITCSGLNLGASGLRQLYFGIDNAPSGPNGPNGNSMKNSVPSGTEVFRFTSITGANQLNYSATTTIENASTNSLSSVPETNTLVFQAGSGTLVTDSTITGLNNANGDVHYLWRVTSGAFTTTVNVKAGGGNALPTVFNPTLTPIGDQDIVHVNLAFYWDTCGNGVREGAEQCDSGASNGTAGACCDANCNFVSSSVTCRGSAGACDVAETCTGSSATCPADAFASTSAVCRAAAGVCDIAETCTGASAVCPADALAPATTECRAAADLCDAAEFCTGSSATCPANALAPTTTVCRPPAGACDVAENCTGASAACPADAFSSSSTTCRAAAGVCDVAENCTGSSAACPTDAFSPSSTVCRASAGVCDPAENCTGSSAACPADALSTSSTVCRAAAGACDIAENCTGSGVACPTDQKSTAVCRAATGVCDVAESCDGVTNDCPTDGFQPDGTTCNDGNSCSYHDECDAGSCAGAFVASCADHYLCYKSSLRGFSPPPSVHLVDEFEDVSVGLTKARSLCTPADENGGGVADASTHLESYAIKGYSSLTRTTKMTDEFGTFSLTTSKADTLFVPTTKSLTSPPAPPNETTIGVNHYKCHKAKIAAGTTPFPRGVHTSVADQFTPIAKIFDVKKPKHLCTPVSQDGAAVKDPAAHLVCYQVKVSAGQPKATRTGVFLSNLFGSESGTTIKEAELCVPAAVVP